ncbi:2-amino-4-hydroxy-6-hydroxymethyldihydropteridine diphosphokinase [Propylenella binzhouense]|uniref:2-amino-4-hydroxy-6-hydroxymethyldihydropteridine diphosphokinase n=1 Tax=Propylenella binzhouense TaxID=2555902 RepID=A0A964T6X8_9HYPH|nr:2-amino-4-hydroxy-6-hydroxymethyldihydropteridine diphosphokinase [Propylenella binzhouense]MYZ49240.1 2-amino-4-hydroxy-6-hydroxymethyldihydropteridine diphosphokinase [Propylenella binzhouense]
MIRAVLGLGANLGDRMANIAAALERLSALARVRMIGISALYESPPWGVTDQPAFLNAAALVETDLDPHALLDAVLAVEKGMGRTRAERWGPRTIDIDILLYGEIEIAEDGLQIPHARLTERAFALAPLVDLCPEARIGGRTAREWLAQADQAGMRCLARSGWYQGAVSGLVTPIVTLTLNPTIDGSSEAETVVPTHKVRTTNERYDPGGGGINVARVVHELGGEALAVALAGGATGALLDELLGREGIPRRLVRIAGHTRISYMVYEASTGREYRFVPDGPEIADAETAACAELVHAVRCRYFVASGSLPRGIRTEVYAELAETTAAAGAKFVLDTSGDALVAALRRGGLHLVKPSLSELEAFSGRPLREPAAQDEAARALARSGAAEMVALTLGADGALLATRDEVHRLAAPQVKARSAVGAGDSFLGAMVHGLSTGMAPRAAFALGVAAGAAAVLTPGTELCRRADVERLLGEMGEAMPEPAQPR